MSLHNIKIAPNKEPKISQDIPFLLACSIENHFQIMAVESAKTAVNNQERVIIARVW